MALKTFEEALKKAIEHFNKVKKCKELSEEAYVYGGEYTETDAYHKFRDADYFATKFYLETLPRFIKKNKISGEKLTKLAMVVLKYAQQGYMGYQFDECIKYYFNKSNMNNKMVLEELIKVRNCNFMCKSEVDEVFKKYNFNYLQNYVLNEMNIDNITIFAIQNKNFNKLNLKKFEEKILEKGEFEHLFLYLYEVEKCNQKAVLSRILEIATPKQLKKFSSADANRKERNKAQSEAYSSGYSSGLEYGSGDFDLC